MLLKDSFSIHHIVFKGSNVNITIWLSKLCEPLFLAIFDLSFISLAAIKLLDSILLELANTTPTTIVSARVDDAARARVFRQAA